MKNLHLILTDKPSTLCINGKNGQHIYITNDEDIQRDWFISLNDDESFMEIIKNNEVVDFSEYADEDWVKNCQKIILTTDQDLIKDGVQAINDEFLEWFVKNPSCEEVEVVDNFKYFNVDELRERHLKGLPHLYSEKISYKIIIPKEEPERGITITHVGKQETLEEAAERFAYDSTEANKGFHSMKMFILGAKWQQERMYSEEEVLDILRKSHSIEINSKIDFWFIKWLTQFKKKP